MIDSPLQKRIARRERNSASLDMNLVALIDIFTILIFFLISNMSEVQALSSSKSVTLPKSQAEKSPKETLVITVNNSDIVVEGRRIASVPEVIASPDDVIAPLKAELELLAGRQVVREENAASTKAITIMGDQSIPYQLLRKVMVTSAQANFTDVAFAVRPQEGSK
jgi:biopolymer transport protein TolR